jgi:hypothetical protein
VRAARDLAAREPRFAAEIAVTALQRLLDGGGYDPGPIEERNRIGDVLRPPRAPDHRPLAHLLHPCGEGFLALPFHPPDELFKSTDRQWYSGWIGS